MINRLHHTGGRWAAVALGALIHHRQDQIMYGQALADATEQAFRRARV